MVHAFVVNYTLGNIGNWWCMIACFCCLFASSGQALGDDCAKDSNHQSRNGIFCPKSIDLGKAYLPFDRFLMGQIHIGYGGDSLVKLKRVSTSCGCLSAIADKNVIPSNDTLTISLTVDASVNSEPERTQVVDVELECGGATEVISFDVHWSRIEPVLAAPKAIELKAVKPGDVLEFLIHGTLSHPRYGKTPPQIVGARSDLDEFSASYGRSDARVIFSVPARNSLGRNPSISIDWLIGEGITFTQHLPVSVGFVQEPIDVTPKVITAASADDLLDKNISLRAILRDPIGDDRLVVYGSGVSISADETNITWINSRVANIVLQIQKFESIDPRIVVERAAPTTTVSAASDTAGVQFVFLFPPVFE